MAPFRIGTTSYILPDEILPNVRFLAEYVDDVELVLFDVEAGGGNLPSPEVMAELRDIAERTGLTYTVHLPLDLRFSGAGSERDASLSKAHEVIRRTRELKPWAYVLHLDRLASAIDPRWVEQAARALEIIAEWVGDPWDLAVENLEETPMALIELVLARVPVARCVDVGHLWRDGHDPIPHLEHRLDRTKVIHIHGVAERDHRSLERMPRAELERVVRLLVRRAFEGVLTIEVFSWADLQTSLERLCGLEGVL
jgi:sugar phosphate isomerase/epimerase